jgi:2-methylcitrate dehydratase PrpD
MVGGGTLRQSRKHKRIAMTVLERMGEWVAATPDSPLPDGARRHLAIHLLDTLGAWIAGSAIEEGENLARLESSPSQLLNVFGRQALDRIALGVATTRLTEIDDIHMPSCTTPGSVVVPTALVVASQMQRQDSQAFAHAMSVGYELMTRFGAAISGPSVLHQGIWPTYMAAPICAAAVTARLLGLSPEKTAHALGIALTMTTGAPGRPIGESPRWLLLGMAARAGCTAALAAASGYAGDLTLFDDDWMSRTHGIPCDAGPLVAPAQGDGAIGEVSFKPYCAAKQTIAAIEAFQNLLKQGISPHDIVALRVYAPPEYAEMVGHRNAAASRMARITSAAYQLALAAYRPRELENVARPNFANDPEIAALMDRVEVVPDKLLAPIYPRRWPAGVEATLGNGQIKIDLVLDAKGDPLRSCDLDIRPKFHRLADPIIGTPAADELAETCLNATENDEALSHLCAKMNLC